MSTCVDAAAENVRFVIKRNGEKVSFELSGPWGFQGW